ncbi:FAS1-like dehydratase domain-containing protein [Halomonas sp. RA08-2]|uniref:FAS1-like dehydratase domain-containing protein n=1 Tax=Halomonas sp. RA08-2 TaxID=3440842 RepID=UPI003EEE0C98
MVRFDRRWLALEGHRFRPFQARIERDRVLRYLDFQGQPDFLGQPDDEAVRGNACDDIGPALPTFPFALEMDAGVVAEVAALLRVEANRLLHAEQTFTCHGPLRCGDLVTVESRLRDVAWKPESRVCFFVKESRFLVDGRLAVSSRSVYALKVSEEAA